MKYEGVIPALVTPFDKDGEVNYTAVPPLVNRLIENGIGGLFVCGSTGEWWALTQEERQRLLEAVIQAVDGRVPVMAHVGSTSTRFATSLAAHAESAGADAISALPPAGRPHSPEDVWGYFKAIGKSSRLPLYLYHLPQVYGEQINMDRFAQAMDEIPTLAGAKFSSYRIDDLINLRLKAKGRLNIISGCGEQILSATACGADGSICTWYNYIPRLASKIVERVKANDVPAARDHEELLVAFAMLCLFKSLGVVKWLISQRGLDVGCPRLPTASPTPEECRELLPKLEATGIFDWAI